MREAEVRERVPQGREAWGDSGYNAALGSGRHSGTSFDLAEPSRGPRVCTGPAVMHRSAAPHEEQVPEPRMRDGPSGWAEHSAEAAEALREWSCSSSLLFLSPTSGACPPPPTCAKPGILQLLGGVRGLQHKAGFSDLPARPIYGAATTSQL